MSNIVLNIAENEVNIEYLKDVIKKVTIGHSKEIFEKESNDSIPKRKFDIGKIAKPVILLEQFKALDQTALNEAIKTLEHSIRSIMDSNILVKDRDNNELVPLPYEVLSLFFSSTSEQFRRQFFSELMEYYYNELSENMKNMSTTKLYTKEDFEQQVKILLPIVKLEAVNKLLHTDNYSQGRLSEIISNIKLFFKYPRLNQEDIFAIVNNKLGSKNYDLLSYELIPLNERNGHLGDYFRLKVSVKFEETERKLNLFAKFLKPNLASLSKREEFFLMTFLPSLEKHGLQSLLDLTPNCYYYKLNDFIILDDMTFFGFTTFTPNTKIEYESLLCVIKQIAKLHACSMILEEILSKNAGKTISLHDLYEDYVFEVVLVRNNRILNFQWFSENLVYLIEKFPEFTKNIATDDFKRTVTRTWEIVLERVKKSDKYKNTICHGDMHIGNMLFKFDAEKRCQDATLLDWQTYRYCPPVHDLLFVIYQNSLKDVRDKHYRQLVDAYYIELSAHFKHFHMDIDKIYSRKEFEESLTYMKPQAVLHAIKYSEFNSIEPSIREEIFQSVELSQKYFRTDSKAFINLGMEDNKYRQALGGLIKDLVELYESGSL